MQFCEAAGEALSTAAESAETISKTVCRQRQPPHSIFEPLTTRGQPIQTTVYILCDVAELPHFVAVGGNRSSKNPRLVCGGRQSGVVCGSAFEPSGELPRSRKLALPYLREKRPQSERQRQRANCCFALAMSKLFAATLQKFDCFVGF